MSAASYRTVARPARVEIDKIRGSRFLATVRPVDEVEAATGALGEIAAAAPDASHHCWAWRLDAQRFRFGDDGEPSGTAGRPILQQIEGRELVGVLVVVTRWFGGTRLGAGGLVRAYGQAAAAGLDAAGTRVVVRTATLTLRFDYPDAGAVSAVLARHAIAPLDSAFGARVEQRVAVALGAREAFERELRDRTAGRIEIDG